MMKQTATRRVGASLSVVLTALLLTTIVVDPTLAAKKPWEKFQYPELGDVVMPGFERHVLDNGMVVFLMEDHQWPMVEGRGVIRTGAAYEPGEKVGLAAVAGDVLRTGGTTTIPSDELDEMLESMGGYIESWVEDTAGGLRFSFVNQDASRGLELVADVLRNPAFEEDKIDVALTAERAVVARRNDELFGIVGREIQKAVWGPDHPYARHTEYTTLDAITREDIVDFYEYFYHPNNVMLALWGDFNSAFMLSTIQERFGDWPKVENMISPLPDQPNPGPRRVMVANKDDVTQSRFAVGTVGLRASDPDYFAMSVMNRILGGGFSDRLFNEVRSNLGLAYNVGSSAGIGFDRPGTFQAYCGTKNETVDQALGAVLGEIEKMRETEVTDTELADAKEMILNSHVFNFVTKGQILTRMVNYEYWGYPEDFMETYPDKVRAVTKTDVQSVATRRMNPDNFAIVSVGKVDEWDGDLTSYGPVEELDITIPEPEGEQFPPPTDETIEMGRAMLASARDAMGGRGLTGLESMKRTQSLTIAMQGMEFAATVTSSLIYPDRVHSKINMPFGEMVSVVDGETVWRNVPQQGIVDVTGAEAEEARLELLKDPLYLLGHFDGFQVQSLEPEMVGDADAQVTLVRISDDEWMKLYFDATSNFLLKSATMGKHPMTQTPGLMEVFYEDLKTVKGILVPHTERTLHGGEQLFLAETSAVEINPTIDASIFEKPSS